MMLSEAKNQGAKITVSPFFNDFKIMNITYLLNIHSFKIQS